jgi:hypothetical protein
MAELSAISTQGKRANATISRWANSLFRFDKIEAGLQIPDFASAS